MSASTISRQLAYVSDSLEKVVLCTVNRNKASQYRGRLMAPMTSVVSFPKLKDVSLGAHYLFNGNRVSSGNYSDWEDALNTRYVCELLPPNVEKLCLTQFCAASCVVLTHIINHVKECSKERFPRLREIQVGTYPRHWGGDLTP